MVVMGAVTLMAPKGKSQPKPKADKTGKRGADVAAQLGAAKKVKSEGDAGNEEVRENLPAIPPEEMKKMCGHLSYLKSKGDSRDFEEYHSLLTREEKREWYWNKYSKDKKLTFLYNIQTKEKYQAAKKGSIEGWFFEGGDH